MAQHQDSLWLYHLTLRSPSHSLLSVVGNFSGSKKFQELVVATNTTIEVYRPNTDSGKLDKLQCQQTFALIQKIDKIRLSGTNRDLLVVTADSGALSVLQLDTEAMKFYPIVQEPHSKSALRRLTPGEYLCVEPRGRAILVGAIERDALVYKVEMVDSKESLALLSPLSITTKSHLTLCMCALDNSYENPMWAAIEIDYSAYDHKTFSPASTQLQLAYYELDQGLNHVIRRPCKTTLPSTANALIPVPGPVGGVLIGCGTYLIYEDGPVNAKRLYLQLPIREKTQDFTVVCHLLHTLKKNDFFLLLQTSFGDLIKVTLAYDLENEKVINLAATYFDTIPVCNSINVFKAGYLFANTSTNNKILYQFELLGEENDTTVRSGKSLEEFVELEKFEPHSLQNLALVDEIETLGPLTDSQLVDSVSKEFPDPLKQLVTTSSDSYLKTLNYGLSVSELVSSPLPLAPTDVYTTKVAKKATSDQYLVLTSSLSQKTLVLSVGEVVEEVKDSEFETDQHTLAVQQIGESSVVQVHANGIRNIKHLVDVDFQVTSKTVTEWFPPAGILVLHATTNNEQIVVALSNREIVYFEVDQVDDQLLEYQERFEVAEGSITAVAIATNLISERRSSFLIVGTSDESIQVLSLMSHNCLEVLTIQALSSTCRSLLLLPLSKDTLYVHIGMDNGIYVRVGIDSISGKLHDSRLKYLGPKPVRLRSLKLPNMEQAAILAFSSRTWIGYFNFDQNLRMFPLLNSAISSGTSFFSDDIGVESVIGIHGDNLSIFLVGREDGGGLDFNSDFVVSLVKLRYTPKRLLKAPKGNKYYILQSQQNIVSPFGPGEVPIDEQASNFGYESKIGSCASCIQVVDHDAQEVTQSFEFGGNVNATCMTMVKFDNSLYLVVGSTPSSLSTFRIEDDAKLTFVHETRLDGTPTALQAYDRRIVVCVGNQIRLYEMGKKQLLKKSTTTVEFLSRVTRIEHIENGLFVVGDSNASTCYFNFDAATNHFVPLTCDTANRSVTALASLDKRTVIAGDRFGNIFVNRVPQDVAKQMSNNILTQFNDGFLNGPSSRVSKLCDFYVADIPTSFHKGLFVIGGTESVIYTGLQGTVGLMLPLATIQETQLLLKFEQALRKFHDRELEDVAKMRDRINLVGREQLKFRGYYNPVKNVIDGDFLEKYYELEPSTKIKIASELGRVPRELERKLHDLRNRAAF